jgi:hypothetical protein
MKLNVNVLSGSLAALFGLLIAFGPQFLFRFCSPHGNEVPMCFWTAGAEIGVGLGLAAMGICLVFFNDKKIQLGLFIGIFLIAITAFLVPNWLIGGCGLSDMDCRRITFPALNVLSILTILGAGVNIYFLEKKAKA